ncbi:bacillithiol biosynthesis cysteine-adding enzyme BshC [Neobacillus sp. SM06]|uniref:bacillithiol biosynthesis cysteine-adding enzyme BshC n=1 Tax=Neobacillus sp. SM06 TaxID=3422492 RepID=UPI003D2DE959
MEIFHLSLPATNRFASEYLQQTATIQPFFHYPFNQPSADGERLAELKNRPFPRNEMAEYIENFMAHFPTSSRVKTSLEKLRHPDSVVVIGGQQAGILTGPLYTLHKVISIIKLAEQKEKELNVPVVPVFWIAGEDHDYQEVNHVFLPMDQKVDKWIYPEKVQHKKMVSDIDLYKETCLSWAKNVIENFGETEHTNTLLDFVGKQLAMSNTFVDFFAFIIMELFKDYGLLIVDSGDRELRQLEKEWFKKQIHHHDSITHSLLEQQQKISQKGFPITLEVSENAANLFYYDQERNERILLEFDRHNDRFMGRNGTVSFSKEDLLQLADEQPEKLSNNVVTRPLMQEWLFPTIAFIAGPGEISYWAELKLVFEHFGIKLPPIVPRLNITLLDRSTETDLAELNLDLAAVLARGTEHEKQRFLESIKDQEIDSLFTTAKEQLHQQYKLIEAKTNELDKGLLPLLEKNEGRIRKQIDFMEKKLEESVQLQHQVVLNKFARVDLALRPDGFPQERIWNVFYYLNLYGLALIEDLMELPFVFDGTHKVIKL